MIMELSNRLETIASFVTEGYVVADIGTDHGYIPIYLTSNGNCPRAYAMDVNKEPLSRAKTHIEEENAGEVVSCILSDGLHELPQDDVDSIVIAGMGGDLVVRILEQDFDKLANVKELILSPQSHLERVRHFLNDHGFRILEEEFLNAALKTMKEEYGSINQFMIKGLNISMQQKEDFKQKVLE